MERRERGQLKGSRAGRDWTRQPLDAQVALGWTSLIGGESSIVCDVL